MSILELTMHYSLAASDLVIVYIKKSPVRRQRKVHIYVGEHGPVRNDGRIDVDLMPVDVFSTNYLFLTGVTQSRTIKRACPILEFDL